MNQSINNLMLKMIYLVFVTLLSLSGVETMAMCPAYEDPVCSVNGVTYYNICYLLREKDTPLYNGPCRFEQRHHRSHHENASYNPHEEIYQEEEIVKPSHHHRAHKQKEIVEERETVQEQKKEDKIMNEKVSHVQENVNDDQESSRTLDSLLSYPQEHQPESFPNDKTKPKDVEAVSDDKNVENQGLLTRLSVGIKNFLGLSNNGDKTDSQNPKNNGRLLDLTEAKPSYTSVDDKANKDLKKESKTDETSKPTSNPVITPAPVADVLEVSTSANVNKNKWKREHRFVSISSLIDQNSMQNANFKRLNFSSGDDSSSVIINIPNTTIVEFKDETDSSAVPTSDTKKANDSSQTTANSRSRIRDLKPEPTEDKSDKKNTHSERNDNYYQATEGDDASEKKHHHPKPSVQAQEKQRDSQMEPEHQMRSRNLRINDERSFD